MPNSRTPRPNQIFFTRPAPAAVTYDLSMPDQATITVPPGSSWTSGPHWHEKHTEFLQVLSGRSRVTLGERTFVVSKGDGVVTVPRGVVHEWRRADREGECRGENGDGVRGEDEEGEELVVREWTEPKDGAKEVFFRNLNGLVLDAATSGREGSWTNTFLEIELWNLFWRADNYPVVLSTGWIGGVATKVVMGLAVTLGWAFGCRGVYDEYAFKRRE
ncbi:hypothetical protein F4806DRAFT_136200 [Annulohypoxylon nitens]|nr:hypothetical protein F4806DRAFT_136200 [Annulohypoxylon nitens]